MISIIIVNYKTFEMTAQTVRALQIASKGFTTEILLVDNGSGDQSGERLSATFPDIIYIPLTENIGFGRANNVALHRASHQTILLLNSDVTLDPDALTSAYTTLWKSTSTGCVGAKLTLPTGSLDHACHRGIPTPFNSFCYFSGLSKLFPKSKLFGGYLLTWLSPDESHPVDAITGAFMLLKKEVLDEIGFFDERYFMYGEDLDLCMRINKSGKKIIYEPSAKGIHHKGGSSTGRPYWLIKEFYRAMRIFHRTHIAPSTPTVFNLLTELGISIFSAIALTKRFMKGLTQ